MVKLIVIFTVSFAAAYFLTSRHYKRYLKEVEDYLKDRPDK